MLDLRIYRAGLPLVLISLLVAAFSLADRPRALRTTLVPDAFQKARADQTLQELVRLAPDRRPGSAGDDAVADAVAAELRSSLASTSDPTPAVERVRTQSFTARTVDGTQTLTNVLATRSGQPGPGIVVVAHRDALGRGAAAELSGTAVLLELARVVADGRLRRSITFVSTSGGTGGLAGARAAAEAVAAAGPVDAVLVLGDMAGTLVRKPLVIPYSNGPGLAPLRLRRTVEAAVREEATTQAGGPRATSQLLRQAFPATPSEAGAFGRAGLAAVELSVSGELAPPASTPVSVERMDAFGRAALRTITALDSGPSIGSGPRALLVTQRKVLPGWAVRLLVGALLLPVVLTAIDAAARARRRSVRLRAGLGWWAATVLPFALTAAVCVLLSVLRVIDPAPAAPLAGRAVELDARAGGTLVVLALILVLALTSLRPAALRLVAMANRAPGPEGAVGALAGLAIVLTAVWIANPFAAALLVPAAHLWLLALALDQGSRPVRLVLVAAGVVPWIVVAGVQSAALGLSTPDAVWAGVLLVAGGHVTALGWLALSALAGTAVAVALAVVRRVPDPVPPDPALSVRGPVGYAGPGSLGGTSSALRP